MAPEITAFFSGGPLGSSVWSFLTPGDFFTPPPRLVSYRFFFELNPGCIVEIFWPLLTPWKRDKALFGIWSTILTFSLPAADPFSWTEGSLHPFFVAKASGRPKYGLPQLLFNLTRFSCKGSRFCKGHRPDSTVGGPNSLVAARPFFFRVEGPGREGWGSCGV